MLVMCFLSFTKWLAHNSRVKIKVIRSDNGKEYFNQVLSSFLEKEGIIHQYSCINSPQQNGVAEQKNKHLVAIT